MRSRPAPAPALLLAVVLGGCGLTPTQKEATKAFSGASERLGDSAVVELNRMRSDTLALGAMAKELTVLLGRQQSLDLEDGAVRPQHIAVRVQAARFLQSYGALLYALATNSQRDAIDKAATRLTGSLSSLPSDYLADDAAALGAIGKLVSEIGFLFTEASKARVMKEIVPKFSRQVDKIASLLRDDFDVGKGGLATKVLIARADLAPLLADVNEALAGDDTAPAQIEKARDRGPAMADTVARALLLHKTTQDRMARIYGEVSGAAAKAGAAHRQLELALEDEAFDLGTIKAFAGSVETLLAALSALSG